LKGFEINYSFNFDHPRAVVAVKILTGKNDSNPFTGKIIHDVETKRTVQTWDTEESPKYMKAIFDIASEQLFERLRHPSQYVD